MTKPPPLPSLSPLTDSEIALVKIVDLPPENDQYQAGEREKCRYRRVLY